MYPGTEPPVTSSANASDAAKRANRPPRRGSLHWESWLLRLLLVATALFQLWGRNTSGATVAGEGVVVSLAPQLLARLSRTHVPRPAELLFTLAIALQFTSESVKLFELLYYWDKVVHPTEIALAAALVGWLVLGYRDALGEAWPTRLGALVGFLFGVWLGVFWEFVEFSADWFGNTGLQKSVADTTSDLFANAMGAFVATLLAAHAYDHWLSATQRQKLGALAHWLGGGSGRWLDRHGPAAGLVLAGLVTAGIAAALWVDRGPPALDPGQAAGTASTWSFVSGGGATGTNADTSPLLGDWVPDGRGICRVNLDQPRPGSEQPGLLRLGSSTAAFGLQAQPFAVTTRYLEARPPKRQGTQMDAGIAFGLRGPKDYYLLEVSALHDVVRLDRYVSGRRRDVREELVRTRGDEWHTLGVQVRGETVTAELDGAPLFAVAGLADTAGGIGLWGQTAEATCFEEARVAVG